MNHLNIFAHICSVESSHVNLRSQLKVFYKPVRGLQATHEPDGFFAFRPVAIKGRGVVPLSVPRKGINLSGVILRAIRRRDIKTFSDALARYWLAKARGPK